jgi:hypothetical protein
MERKEITLPDSTRDDPFPRSKDPRRKVAPDEGIRLMRAFVNIRRRALREAIIDFVAKISHDGG